MVRGNEGLEEVLSSYLTSIDDVIARLVNGRARRAVPKVRLKPHKPNAGRVARNCGRENRRACEEALKWVCMLVRCEDVEDAIRRMGQYGVMPEVVIAYLYALVLGVLGVEVDNAVRGSIEKVVIDLRSMAISLEPLRGSFTITDARNVLPSLRLKA